MNKESSTLPKNMILNWLYSAEMHVPLDKLGKWLEQNTNGKYKLVDTDAQRLEVVQSNNNPLYKDCA
ncbi:MAG: hypothetical protein EBY20_09685 [Alphaproteobacteria bacterium]|jgi:hypothetical protein|nr:hypothetical protein [Alphaproteobacteria bacterium]